MSPKRFRILQPSDAPALERFLAPRLESSMFLIGNAREAGLSDRGEVYQGSYCASFEGGDITGVAAHYWNGNVILQAPHDAGALAIGAAEASGRPIHSLLGPSEQVADVRAALGVGSDAKLDSTEKLYSLDLGALALPEQLTSGGVTARRVEPRDVELLVAWRITYSIEALGEEDTPALHERCRGTIERYVVARRMWLLEDRGAPVACTAFNAVMTEAVQVGGVWTEPELRSRGYARAVVAASLLDARAEGCQKGILFTPVENIPAQRAYEAIGFRQIGSYSLLALASPQAVHRGV